MNYTLAQIEGIRTSNKIPTTAVLHTAPDGTLIWTTPDITDAQLGFNSLPPVGQTYNRSIFDISGVYLVVAPLPNNIINTSPIVIATPTANISLTFNLDIIKHPSNSYIPLTFNINISPAIPKFAPAIIDEPWQLTIHGIPVPLSQAIKNAVLTLIGSDINNYFDVDRVGKTLLNFGQDYQAPIINWQYDTSDNTSASVLVKLYNPLPPEVNLQTNVWIVRELSPTLIDQVSVIYIPSASSNVYLRPPNKNISVQSVEGNEIDNITLTDLLTTGSFDLVTPSDPVVQKWFSTALEGAELNIDYSNFSNFVFYSSAKQRIEAFKQKLLLLENYNNIITDQSSSIAAANSGSGLAGFTASLAYNSLQSIVQKKQDVIRSFDGYERFLYYDSASAYSSSFSGDPEDQLYYFVDATWPKISGSVISVASASNSSLYGVTNFTPQGDLVVPASWLDVIEFIATDYDDQNQNRLSNNLPSYLLEDQQSQEFIKFIDMIGHHFDVLYLYTSQMTQIYDRNNDPLVGVSQDLIWNVAKGFGISLPSQYSIKTLMDYTIGDVTQVDPVIYRQMAAETWKRFLHNQIYLLKTKGTRNALLGLLNVYGVLPTTIQIRETSTPSLYTTQSFEVFEEQTNALNITSGSYVSIPFSGSNIPAVQTIQVRFSPINPSTSSILFNVDTDWAVTLQRTGSNNGIVNFVSGSTIIMSSSVMGLYSGDYYSLTLQNSASSITMYVQSIDTTGELVNNFITSSNSSIWSTGSILYLGSHGMTSLGDVYVGYIDEFRLWSELLNSNVIQLQAQYPALYNGNTSSSAKTDLNVRLSFNKPYNLGTGSGVLPNESPYINNTGVSSLLLQFSASNFQNISSYPYNTTNVTRTVLRYSPNFGGSQYTSNKIIISDPAIPRYFSNDSGSSIPILSHNNSIVPLIQKYNTTQNNNIIGFYFSIADAINDSIIKSIGNINLQDYIGDPSNLYSSSYSSLDNLNQLFWTDYAYTYNFNEFIDFIENLLQPLFIQAKELIPARSKLLSGVVVESPMLERHKIKWNPIELSGINTQLPNENPTLYADSLTTITSSLFGDYFTKETVLTEIISEVVNGEINFKEVVLPVSSTQDISATDETNETNFDVNKDTSITSYMISLDDSSELQAYTQYLLNRFKSQTAISVPDASKPYFNQLLMTFQPGNFITISIGMNTDVGSNIFTDIIEPYVDFNNLECSTYFTQPDGFVKIAVPTLVRSNQSILSSAGTWTKGQTYTLNQYVTQSNQTGAAAAGNGYEYVCITPLASGSFISYNPPSLDVNNWKLMTYIPTSSIELKVATMLNGHVQLVDPSLGYPPFIGYSSTHYEFNRDKSFGTLNHLWLGCVQTDDTTPDGNPAVQILPSATDVLVVESGAQPIQPSNNSTGPILSVE